MIFQPSYRLVENEGPAVEWTDHSEGSRSVVGETPEVIPAREGQTRPGKVVLVPDGTLSFMRPIVDERGRIIGHEIVWLRPNELGIWEGRGDSGDLYIHEGFYKQQYERQRAVFEAIQEQQVMEERAEFAAFLVRFMDAQKARGRVLSWLKRGRIRWRLWRFRRRRPR